MYKIINTKTRRKAINKTFKTYEAARKAAIRLIRSKRTWGTDGTAGYPTLFAANLGVRKAA